MGFLERLHAEPEDPAMLAAHLWDHGGYSEPPRPCACCGKRRAGLDHLDPAAGTYDCEVAPWSEQETDPTVLTTAQFDRFMSAADQLRRALTAET